MSKLQRELEARPGWLACRGCPATFAPLRNLVQDLEQHATADTRWYLFRNKLDNMAIGRVECVFPTRIKDGRGRDGEEGTPVELFDVRCVNCGMHAGWRIVSEHGGHPRIYEEQCILLSKW